MNPKPNKNPPSTPRRLILAQVCLLLVTGPLAWGQAVTPDAATLAKYDKNHNGRLDSDEIAAMQADQKTTAQPADGAEKSDVVMLSPFSVVTDNKGYYASNTMSGTRFNTKLEDLAASITVVTKEQMADFAMLDINDIFQYTANTEGTGTYTDLTIDRNGSVSDNVQLNPTQANRIRGIGAANISFNNFETSARMPVDPSIIDGVEISRGPNANVFGLGNPSGTLNQILSAANLTRDRSSVGFRGDSYDGFRSSLDVNRVLKKGVLAVRGSAVYQREGFIRKPSGVDTERYSAMVKFQPFKTTTITAGGYYYHSYGTRPNFTNPRDSVSYWVKSGKPTWDPIAEVIHVNGTTIGPITASTFPTSFAGQNVDYFNNTFTGSTHSYLYIDQGGVSYFAAPSTFANIATGPITGGQVVRFMSASPGAGTNLGKFTGQPLFTTTPSVADKSIYDWTKINLASVNHDEDREIISTAQLDQIFLNTPRHMIAMQLAAMREDSQRYRRDYVGIANDNGQVGPASRRRQREAPRWLAQSFPRPDLHRSGSAPHDAAAAEMGHLSRPARLQARSHPREQLDALARHAPALRLR